MADMVAAGRYWCHMCATAVSPLAAEAGEDMRCPYCHSGFLEEMETARSGGGGGGGDGDVGMYPGADSTISIWAPIIDGMVGDTVRRRRNRRSGPSGDVDEDYGVEPMDFSRRRRRAAAFLRLLEAIRERQFQRLESATAAGGAYDDAEHYSPYGRSLFAGGEQGVALGDYFLGPGLDALLQQLAESDASRQGTPPAKKEAVEAMPTVEVSGGGGGSDGDGDGDAASCAVCLEDYAPGERAREMPCRHWFHSKCILPWLEMHSSCPVCRFQLPADDDSKTSCGGGGGGGNGNTSGAINGDGSSNANDPGHGSATATERDDGVEAGENGSRLPASIQWLNNLLYQPSSSTSGGSH